MLRSQSARFIPNELPDYASDACVDSSSVRHVQSGTWSDLQTGLRSLVNENPPAGSDTSVYTGLLGFVFLFVRLHMLGIDPAKSLKRADHYLAHVTEIRRRRGSGSTSRITMIEGEAGFHALGAAVAALSGDAASARRRAHRLLSLQTLAVSNDFPFEILYGTAGYLYALLFVRALPATAAAASADAAIAAATAAAAAAVTDDAIRGCVQHIVFAGKAMAAAEGLPMPALMYQWHGSRYLGGAHGVSGIALVLIQALEALHGGGSSSVGSGLKEAHRAGTLPAADKEALEHAVGALRYIVSLQLPSGNFPSRPESSRDELVQWCHGAPGVVPALVAAYRVVGDERLLASAERGAEAIWRRGLLTKGNGLCHGVAGNAYSFLSLWRVTGDPKQLHRAAQFAEFTASADAARLQGKPDNPGSIFEGYAGALCLQADLLDPAQSRFPCYEI